MKNIMEKIEDKTIELRKITVEDLSAHDSTEIEYISNVKYKIIDNKLGIVTIRAISESFFNPEGIFKANMEFNVYLEINGEISNEELEDNIKDILYTLGSEITYLLTPIIKSMKGGALIVPPMIDKIEKI
ncbi:hypothetical protein [uncultured Clostridium sp.]|uniref:hypothetical protein n=1 Tax=uncultured Clostridium sp. TaxID=59620 RepID=UPI0025EFEBAB|nr:hypothetical protein [uncultured Clostridium sp.]MDU4884308.1 hypothetical protein [Clostridium celatum]MDU7077492.1 hypothetical protein [Clostridium celatum]